MAQNRVGFYGRISTHKRVASKRNASIVYVFSSPETFPFGSIPALFSTTTEFLFVILLAKCSFKCANELKHRKFYLEFWLQNRKKKIKTTHFLLSNRI